MINRDNTFTVAELLKMLADGRVTPDMPLAVWRNDSDGNLRGFTGIEIQTYRGGEKILVFFDGDTVADVKCCLSSSEVFP